MNPAATVGGASSTRVSHSDVVVIGGGVAGLAAGRALLEHGRSIRIFEAGAQLGGRAWTDDSSFSSAVDLGGAWAHGWDSNPLRPFFEQLESTSTLWGPMFQGAQAVGPGLAADVEEQLEAFEHRARAALERGQDPAAIELLPAADRPEGRIAALIRGEFEAAAPLELVSAEAGVFRSDPGDRLFPHGLGQGLVELLSRGLPEDAVRLGASVEKVIHSPQGVRVELADGSAHEARLALVTVSVGVLKAGTIEFDPPLTELQEALDGLDMGLMDKIVLQLAPGAPNPLAAYEPNTWITLLPGPGSDAEARPVGLLAVDPELLVGFVGGEDAFWLETLTDADAGQWLLRQAQVLAEAGLTDPAEESISQVKVTRWGDPGWAFTRGAYSVARPGHAMDRARLGQPLSAGTLRFAGEAVLSGGAPPLAELGEVGSYARAVMSALDQASRMEALLAAEESPAVLDWSCEASQPTPRTSASTSPMTNSRRTTWSDWCQ